MRSLLIHAAILGALLAAVAVGQPVNEYQLKAAYVYNLAKFVEWPAGTFKSATDPITICVLGQTPIRSLLDDAVRGESIDDRKLIVRYLADVQQVSGCQILFVAPSDRKQVRSVVRDPQITGVLTVADTEGFLEEGGAIDFSLDEKRIRIDINMNAVGQQKLRISPKLLNLARIVKK